MAKSSRAAKRDTEFTKDQKLIGDIKIAQYAGTREGRAFIGCKPRRSSPMDCLADEVAASVAPPKGMPLRVYRKLIAQRLNARVFDGMLTIKRSPGGGYVAEFDEFHERRFRNLAEQREDVIAGLAVGTRPGRRGYKWPARTSIA